MSDRSYGGWRVGPGGCPEAGLAAWRDASWWQSPGTARRYHVVAADGGSECCGMPLVTDIAQPPEAVALVLRCMRHGCRERWPRNP